jgi:tetratricopeptide (TPR) repeat protein
MFGPEVSIPSDSLSRAAALHERAIALREAARLPEAERCCRRALELYEAAEGRRHPDVANALVELGQIVEARDRLREAARHHRRALAILAPFTQVTEGAAADDADLLRLALRARVLLAGVERALGNYAAADRLFVAGLRDTIRWFGPRDPDVASILNNRGVLRKAQGRYAEAVVFYKRALALLGRGGDTAALATLHHNLGGIEHARGRYAAGEPHARRSVELRERLLGRSHPSVAADVAALAALVDARGRLDEAAGLYRRALAVFHRTLGPDSVEVGLNLAGLAALRQRQGRVREAEGHYEKSLSILERVFGRAHPEVALTVNNLAYLVRETGDLRRAERLYARASRTFERALGVRHPHTRLSRANHRAILAQIGGDAAAPGLKRKARYRR